MIALSIAWGCIGYILAAWCIASVLTCGALCAVKHAYQRNHRRTHNTAREN
jgi:hypothetical protein